MAHTNRLAQETSPYLLQHAHNPVDWYPWGPEAFEAARTQGRPIFLSVGYSTCYWCHVMERQSFENEAIAGEMNQRFINVKVDREERPDVDQLYMNAVHAVAGQGGWPMSVFLTPELKPFYAGTYFPPADGHGRVGLPRLLAAIDDAWKNRREQVEQSAEQIVHLLRRMAEPPPPRAGLGIDRQFLDDLLDRSTSDYDPALGGFGSAPKFPRQTLLELILVSQREFPDQTRMDQVLHTLEAMASGGIRDQLGGAFHRYSTDDQWLVPHFEIMLYDNAMLAWVYAEAYAQTKRASLAAVARGVLDFVLREMTSPQGAFYTAFDAEVDAREGLSYLWTPAEIEEVLGKDAALFNRVYGLDGGPNFADPHYGGGTPERNVLYLAEPVDQATEQKLAPMRRALYARRRQRKQPSLDTKVLTSWNALMIRALAHAGNVLGEPAYLAAANRAADLLLEIHRTPDGGLHRTSRDAKAKGEGFLDDYAFMAQALLALGRRRQAEEMNEQTCRRFLDSGKGGFFFTAADSADMLVRQKTASDSPLPSGNGVAALVCLELGRPEIARDTIACFAGQLDQYGQGMSAMAQAAVQYVPRHGAISIGGGGPEAASIVTAAAHWSRPDLLHVTLAVAPGYHVNGHVAAGRLTPTRLTIGPAWADAVADIEYPPPKMQKFAGGFAEVEIPIYDGRVVIAVRFGRPVEGEQVALFLQYQPCDEQSCLAVQHRKLVVQ